MMIQYEGVVSLNPVFLFSTASEQEVCDHEVGDRYH